MTPCGGRRRPRCTHASVDQGRELDRVPGEIMLPAQHVGTVANPVQHIVIDRLARRVACFQRKDTEPSCVTRNSTSRCFTVKNSCTPCVDSPRPTILTSSNCCRS